MNTKLLLLAVAATFATASCSQEKKTETTETTTAPGGEVATTTTTTTTDTAAYRTEAGQLADRVATDLSATDAAVKTRLENVYYSRGRAIRDLDARYAADTTGRYAALKAANDQATSEIQSIVTPTQYKTYTTSQGTYYSGPYTTTTVTTTTAARPSLGARVGQGSGVKKMERENDGDHKVKYENGAKIKREDDGSLKIKRADGTKVKIDENGHKTVKKGLF
jgi:hypothetical protein